MRGNIHYPFKRQAKYIADDILIFVFISRKKISLDISCESSAWQMIYMKYHDLFFYEKYVFLLFFLNVVCCSYDWHFKG